MESAAVFLTTANQALFSALAALTLGIFGGLGLIWAKGRWPFATGTLTALVLLPSAAPVLLFLLSIAKLFPWARGFWGIVFVHASLNIGLVSVAVAQSAVTKLSGPAELALVEGATRRHFLFRGALPALKQELALLFLFLFALCFASFAVPLTIGGSRATTVEVLIYQKLRINGEWGAALGLALVQIVLLMILSIVIGRPAETGAQAPVRTQAKLDLLFWAPGLLIALIPSAFLFFGLATGLERGAHDVLSNTLFLADLPRLLAGSVVVGFGCGGLVTCALMTLAYAQPSGLWQKFWRGLTAPSPTLTGFALLIAWRSFGLASYGKIIFGLGVLWLPTFFRYRWEALLATLQNQIAVARVLGASESLIFRRVVGPQCLGPALRIGGLAAFWAWGDFALSRVVAERTLTVAMAAQEMLESYRFEGATVTVWLAVLGGLCTFGVFSGAAYVFGEKS